MGLRDLLGRKKSKETDAGLVGGLTDTDWETNLVTGPDFGQESDEPQDSQERSPAWPGFSGSAGQAAEGGEGREEQEEKDEPRGPEQGESGASSLDIFTMETGEKEDASNKLARQLPAVDIRDLLRECQEMVATLRRQID
ncbi:MAG TPA: hypothetical protein DCY61_04340 [Dehalococcoidia bacterium]|nr:hypothetical protein [Dehalococcoidia bacterium]